MLGAASTRLTPWEIYLPTRIFKLHANCIPIRGARRSLICDLQKQRAHFIPNGLFCILTNLAGKSIEDIKASFDAEDASVIDEYFELLLRKDYGFLCDEPDQFPPLDLRWERPAKVTNAIIDVDRNSQHDYKSIFSQLDDLGCQAVEVRAYDELSLSEIQSLLAQSAGRRLRHIGLIIKYDPSIGYEALARVCREHQWISTVTVHSSPYSEIRHVDRLPVEIMFLKAHFELSCCGQVDATLFALNVDHFTEAQHFNTCLNRKISICTTGEIKSCPSMQHSLGNIRQVTLAKALSHPDLAYFATITKDQVEVCRDCEFRYICTDCRAYTSDASTMYSKPAKCMYDPYTASWAGDQ